MKIKDWKKEILTIPNLLSFFRLALIPTYMVIYLNATETWHYYLSAGILAVSCLTDLADGYIARKYNMITTVGKILDPVADKATQFALIICLATRYPLIWVLIGIFVVKESFQLIAGAIALKKGKMLDGALMSGKICTTVFFLSLILMIMLPELEVSVANVFIWVDCFFMLFAFFDYILAYYGKNKKVKNFEDTTDNTQ